jgi:hypothetical protein
MQTNITQMKRLLILVLGNLFVVSLCAQHISRINQVCTDSNMEIATDQAVGALVLRGKGIFPAHAELIANVKRIQLSRDEHVFHSDSTWTTNLIVFEPPANNFSITGLVSGEEYELITIRLPELILHSKPKSPFNDCSEPDMVLQSEWRDGLPVPDYDRIFNQVHNIVLHHSATSNALTDYTALVRSIYTYHTDVNGWSDIGYNYLIAPDGTIFAGRDPGNDMETHQVLGAHFCASNTGTMGICLLGTYMNEIPTAEMTASLIQLLSWKTALDSIPPLAFHPHPLDPELPSIAGHRDGCSTLCPGDLVYEQLQTYRNHTQQQLISCGVFLGLPDEIMATTPKASLYPNPVRGQHMSLVLENEPVSVQIFDTNGRQFSALYKHNRQQLLLNQNLPQGIYLVLIRYETGVEWLKFVRL